MIYVRGGRAVRVRWGRRCAPIMINALHPGDNPASALSATATPPHTHPTPPFLLHHLLPYLTQDLYLVQTKVPTFSPCRREMQMKRHSWDVLLVFCILSAVLISKKISPNQTWHVSIGIKVGLWFHWLKYK